MNKLNTFLSFILLSFCLLINVSHAKVFNNVTGTVNSIEFNELIATSINPTELTERDSYVINSAIEYLRNNNLYDTTNNSYYFARNTSNSTYKIYRHPISAGRNPTYVMGEPYNNNMRYNLNSDYAYVSSIILDSNNNFSYCSDFTLNTNRYNLYFAFFDTASSTLYTYYDITTVIPSVDLALYTSNPDFGLVYYQIGVSYAKENPSTSVVENYYMYGTAPDEPEPDTPTLPTNAEIASAVQAFYNSDYYKNNKDFKDFIVLYNYNNQYFSFIGHNNEDKFQQLIFPDGYKYNQQWWKFGLDGLIDTTSSYLFNKRYWLYSSNDFGENIAYNGEGYMKDLLELNFPISSIIVYSSNDYDVIYYTYNENDELTSVMETMPGDHYTYDENLDPTTNKYNPLESFVPTNPSQTILGDVDFSEINKTFEENKDILNIENASWLFTANNKLVGYFIGFLSLLIVFLIISRILGG